MTLAQPQRHWIEQPQGYWNAQKCNFATVQVQHDPSKASFCNTKVGLRFEAQIELQDQSGSVPYRLALIIFRIGGQHNGHFYVAEPTTAGMWRVLNQHRASAAMSLKTLHRLEGTNAHGLIYVRTKAPAQDDWASLDPNAGNVRPTTQPPPIAKFVQPTSQAEEEFHLQQALAASVAGMHHPSSATSPHPASSPPHTTAGLTHKGRAQSVSSEGMPRPPAATARSSGSSHHTPVHPPTRNPSAPTPASRPGALSSPLGSSGLAPPPGLGQRGHTGNPQHGANAQGRPQLTPSASVAATREGTHHTPLPPQPRGMGTGSRPQGSRPGAAPLSAGGISGLPPPPPPLSRLNNTADPNWKSAQSNLAATAATTMPCKQGKGSAAGGSSWRGHAGNKRAPMLMTITEMEAQGKQLPTGFRNTKSSTAPKSQEEMLAEVAAEGAPGQSLTAISNQQFAVEAALQGQYRVEKHASKPTAADSADESAGDHDSTLADAQSRLLAAAAKRVAEKTAAQERAAALVAGKGRAKGPKQPKTAEQQAAREAKVAARRAEREARALAEAQAAAEAQAVQAKAAAARAQEKALAEAQAVANKAAAEAKVAVKAQGKATTASQDSKAASKGQHHLSSPAQHSLIKPAADSKGVGSAQAGSRPRASASHPTPLRTGSATGGESLTAGEALPAAQPPSQAGTNQIPNAREAAHSTAATPVPVNFSPEPITTKQLMERGSQGGASQQPPLDPSSPQPDKPQTGSSVQCPHAGYVRQPKPHVQQQAAAKEVAVTKEAAIQAVEAAPLNPTATTTQDSSQAEISNQSPAPAAMSAMISDNVAPKISLTSHQAATVSTIAGASTEIDRYSVWFKQTVV